MLYTKFNVKILGNRIDHPAKKVCRLEALDKVRRTEYARLMARIASLSRAKSMHFFLIRKILRHPGEED